MRNIYIWTLGGIIIITLSAFFIFQNPNQKINEAIINGPETETKSTQTDSQIPPQTSNNEPYTIEVSWGEKLFAVPGCEGGPDCDYSKNYIAGQVTNGVFKGEAIFLSAASDMGGDSYSHYVVYRGKKIFLEAGEYEIKGITDLPEEINPPGLNYKMKKWYSPSMLYTDVKPIKKLFTIAVLGDFYLTDYGCIMVQLPDHTAIAYDFEIPFVNSQNGEVDLTFNAGAKNNEQYQYTRIGGCGATCMYLADIESDVLKPNSKLVLAGKTSNGENFYEYKDSFDQTLQDLYNDKNTVAYINNEPGDYKQLPVSKYTYEQFLNYHPLMYWQDPLGRWIEFKNERFLFAAEKCKPVIYLYPKEKTNLNVQVTPNGGFIKTIPQYTQGGWNVEAYPNGDVVDLNTGIKYDYLYWSGIGLNYPINDKEGWVVEKENISPFFDEKLKILGLNDKEILDFKEYWVSKLSAEPYYQISFLPKNQLDQMAPLNISPVHPDTIIRVMLTAKGLTAKKDLKPQLLPETPKRNGFTLAEWGGVLLR